MKVEDRLREILKKVIDEHSSTVVPPPLIIEYVDRTISQIKALVVESLGEEKIIPDDIPAMFNDGFAKERGYNQKISELKKIWGVEG